MLNHEQTLLGRCAKLVSLPHAQVDEDNCPAISPSPESLSFLVLSDNGIGCIVGRQGKFIFIKCCLNVSFSSSQTFHQTAPFCGKLDFHVPDLLGMLPPSAAQEVPVACPSVKIKCGFVQKQLIMCTNESGFRELGTDFPDLFLGSAFSVPRQLRLSGDVCASRLSGVARGIFPGVPAGVAVRLQMHRGPRD